MGNSIFFNIMQKISLFTKERSITDVHYSGKVHPRFQGEEKWNEIEYTGSFFFL